MKSITIIVIFSLQTIFLYGQQNNLRIFKTPIPTIDRKQLLDYEIESNKTTLAEYVDFFSSRRSFFMYRRKWQKNISYSIKEEPVNYFKNKIEAIVNAPPRGIETYMNASSTLQVRIDSLYLTIKTEKGRNELKTIETAIEKLSPSISKANLWRRISNFKVFNVTYFKDVEVYSNKIKEVLKNVHTELEKADICLELGNFYDTYYMSDLAIEQYYLARQYIHAAPISEKIKNQKQALVCTALAALFSKNYFQANLSKASYYTLQAASYLQKNQDYDVLTEQSLSSIASLAFGLDEITKHYSQEQYDIFLKQLFYSLQQWFIKFDMEEFESYDAPYLGTYSIGVLLWKMNYPTIANNYFKESLKYAIENKNYGQIKSCVSFLSYIYAKTGQPELSSKYSALLSPFKRIRDRYVDITEAINKSEAFLNQSMLDSALFTITKLENDTSLIQYFYPPVQDKIYESIFKVKKDVTMRIDSLYGFRVKDKYNMYREFRNEQYANMLEAESKAVTGWLSEIAENELSIREELLVIKESNFQILSKQKRLSDSLAVLNEQIASRKNDSLNMVLNFRRVERKIFDDSLKNEKKIRRLEQEYAEALLGKKQAEIRQSRIITWGVGIAGGLLMAGLFMYQRKKREADKQINLRLQVEQQAETERLNNLVKNNLHNYQNDYMELGLLIDDNRFMDVKKYERYYGTYLSQSFGNWKKGKLVTLEDEIKAGKNYFHAKQVLYPSVELIFENDTTIKQNKAIFIPSIFDTLINNSIKHGFEQEDRKGFIKIKTKREQNFLVVEYSNDGENLKENHNFFSEKEKGLTLMKKRIESIYLNSKIEKPIDFFVAKENAKYEGITIQIKVPYEEA